MNENWQQFSNMVKPGWKVSHSEAFDDGVGLTDKGILTKIERKGTRCPHCDGSLSTWFEIEFEVDHDERHAFNQMDGRRFSRI